MAFWGSAALVCCCVFAALAAWGSPQLQRLFAGLLVSYRPLARSRINLSLLLLALYCALRVLRDERVLHDFYRTRRLGSRDAYDLASFATLDKTTKTNNSQMGNSCSSFKLYLEKKVS